MLVPTYSKNPCAQTHTLRYNNGVGVTPLSQWRVWEVRHCIILINECILNHYLYLSAYHCIIWGTSSQLTACKKSLDEAMGRLRSPWCYNSHSSQFANTLDHQVGDTEPYLWGHSAGTLSRMPLRRLNWGFQWISQGPRPVAFIESVM